MKIIATGKIHKMYAAKGKENFLGYSPIKAMQIGNSAVNAPRIDWSKSEGICIFGDGDTMKKAFKELVSFLKPQLDMPLSTDLALTGFPNVLEFMGSTNFDAAIIIGVGNYERLDPKFIECLNSIPNVGYFGVGKRHSNARKPEDCFFELVNTAAKGKLVTSELPLSYTAKASIRNQATHNILREIKSAVPGNQLDQYAEAVKLAEEFSHEADVPFKDDDDLFVLSLHKEGSLEGLADQIEDEEHDRTYLRGSEEQLERNIGMLLRAYHHVLSAGEKDCELTMSLVGETKGRESSWQVQKGWDEIDTTEAFGNLATYILNENYFYGYNYVYSDETMMDLSSPSIEVTVKEPTAAETVAAREALSAYITSMKFISKAQQDRFLRAIDNELQIKNGGFKKDLKEEKNNEQMQVDIELG